MFHPHGLHWIGCPCDTCRWARTTRPLDRASSTDLLELMAGNIQTGTRQPVRLRLEVEIGQGGRSLRDSRPVRVTVLAVGEDGEPIPLEGGDLDPALLPLLLRPLQPKF
ncbi:hypothetical protein [Streptomyces sp. NRRL B-24484]|uniref:hypothetical protein n=1 Tax=Streptomyces sp. NRRL B-24484 TaxID=1463833 RepID=UPI0004BF7EAB|nr:hypothetical protein [Streptomyces sp. NRRL B-24484]